MANYILAIIFIVILNWHRSMNPQYRFWLRIEGSTVSHRAYPIYSSDVSKNYARESKQMFFRAKIDGKFKFVKSDYAYIIGSAFDDTIFVYIQISEDNGITWNEYFNGKFMRTDCTINSEEQWLETNFEPADNYENILAGLDKEFNLIELAPETEQVNLFKRPAIQIYIDGESVLTTFVSGTYFEQEVTAVNVNQGIGNIGGVLNDMGFRFQKTLDTVTIRAASGGNSAADGSYVNFGYDSPDITLNKVGGGDYRFRWYRATGEQYDYQTIAELIYVPTGEVVGIVESEKYGSGQVFSPNVEYGMTAEKAGGEVLYFWSFTETYIYARLLHDKDSIDGMDVYDLNSNDIANNNANYKKASPVDISDGLEFSLYFSNEPTEWGQYQPGKYFTKPAISSAGVALYVSDGRLYSSDAALYTNKFDKNETFYPIGRSSWIDTSLWFAPTLYNELYDNKAKEEYTLKHAYPIGSCIDKLLKKIAPELAHSSSDSSFLYQPNGYNPISGLSFEILLTQKTNILKGEYDQPAQKAMITLGQILDMLKSCFQCYWYISDGHLKIEHLKFFQFGKSYGANSVGIDLTNIYDSRLKKQWDFGNSVYSFDKEEMPEWYQFDWSDDVSFPFKGYPIEVVSKYIKKGNIENINVNGFVSDIDLMLLNPSAFSEDGMALMIAVRANGKLSLPFVSVPVDGIEYTLQNGYAAFCDLQERYYTWSLPAKKVIINKIERIVVPTRGKKQEIEFPVNSSFDVEKLVKTSLGNGLVKDMKINLSSRLAKVTLMHDTE